MGEIQNDCVKVYVWLENMQALDAPLDVRRDSETGHVALAVKDHQGNYRYLSWWPNMQTGRDFVDLEANPPTMRAVQVKEPKAYGPKGIDRLRKAGDMSPGMSDKKLVGMGMLTDAEQKKAKMGQRSVPELSADVKFQFVKAFDHRKIIDFIDNLRTAKETASPGPPTQTAAPGKTPPPPPDVFYHVLFQNCSSTVAHALHAGDLLNVRFPSQIWLPLRTARYCYDIFQAIKAGKGKSGMPIGMAAWVAHFEKLKAEGMRREAMSQEVKGIRAKL